MRKKGKEVCSIHYDGDLVPASIRHGRGTSIFRTPQYKAFRENLAWLYKIAWGKDPVNDRLFRIEIDMRQFVTGNKRRFYRGDIDNMTKPIMDSATKLVWADDSQVVGLDVWLEKESDNPGFDARIFDVGDWHNYRVKNNCPVCGKEFQVVQSQYRHRNVTYCSNECRAKAHRKTTSCLNCGNEFSFVRSAERGTKFCSPKCYWDYMREHPDEYNAWKLAIKKSRETVKLTRDAKGRYMKKHSYVT